ncbi:MAG: hypothetical protein MUC87_20445 [Bacteroidia bacterium]|jgi:hypothetical protein|nr:hypothetical protein [Bacteroidia bacterium]
MTDRQLTIPKTPELDTSENYSLLRSEGVKFIERLSSKIWTDYNVHDPGITIMELLCYAITDLGYRTSFPLEDILAPHPAENNPARDFFTAAEVLPVNPTTETDLRKIIIDVKGVKNAWITTARTSEAPVYINSNYGELTNNPGFATGILPLNGLFNIMLEYEMPGDGKEESELNTEEKQIRANVKEQTRREVHAAVMAYRNLCEDLLGISEVSINEIAICADIEVRQNADINLVMAKVYQIAINYCSPSLNFYTLEEMLDKGYTVDEIFEGPLLRHGFLDTTEVENANLREKLYTSDLINSIMDIEDVVAVRGFKLLRYEDGVLKDTEPWILSLNPGFAAQFSRLKSKLIFYKGLLPFMAQQDEVLVELNRLQQSSGRFRKTGHKMDIEVPRGKWRELNDYFPVLNDFPMVYGIGQPGLSNEATDLRKAQSRQLKAYMLFFEQLLTNYLAQLAGVRKLFSASETVDRRTLTVTGRSYYTQLLKDYAADEQSGINDFNSLINFSEYQEELNKLVEDESLFAERRNRFLDHLLARFCESMSEYSLILFHQMGKEAGSLRLVADKEALLRDYSLLSRDRGKAFNYRKKIVNPSPPPNQLPDVWNTTNVAGLKVRIARLLGMAGVPVEDEDDSNLRVISTGTNKWRVQLVNAGGDLLLNTSNFTTFELAQKRYYEIRESGMLASNFVTNPADLSLRLNDTGDNNRELAYQFFDTLAELNTFSAQAIALLAEDIIIDRIRRRSIATDMFTIQGCTANSAPGWQVVMNAPVNDNPGALMHTFLTTVCEDSLECAEGHLLFLLHSGDEEDNYVMKDNGPADFSFEFYDDCEPPRLVANGNTYATAEERNAAFTRLLFLFRDRCDIEDFHLLEHILLRPRIPMNPENVPFEDVLPACQTQRRRTTYRSENRFEFDFHDDGSNTFSLRIFYIEEDGSYTKIVDTEPRVEDPAELRELLGAIRRRGMAESNYRLNPPLDVSTDSWTVDLLGDAGPSNVVLCSIKPVFLTEALAREFVEKMANWLAFKTVSWESYLPADCDIPDDPYSFRMSFVLPAWPTRFRSSYFREFVERTIREETPAHIYVKICWVSLQQMRDFELAYKPWLESLNLNEYPDATLTNELIKQMGNLYNVYPTAILHSCDDIDADEPQMILDQTTLGNQ